MMRSTLSSCVVMEHLIHCKLMCLPMVKGFYVDGIPIRVFKNNTKIGVNYPSQPKQVEGSLWNAEGWASNGTKTDWSQAPFKANFQEFNIHGCTLQTVDNKQCYSPKFWWNSKKYQSLNAHEQRAYENVREKYMTYDYCSDRSRSPKSSPECQSNK
ncbi:xyloglucan endotransglucosylase/hydrolase protein 2 [Fagus crenata]